MIINWWIVFGIVVLLGLITLVAFVVPIFKQLKKTMNTTEEVTNRIEAKLR